MTDINKDVYDNSVSFPNKLLQEDGSITDLTGHMVTDAVDVYKTKKALPNKWLNPDGTYATLAEILSGSIDIDLFIVVDELPATGEPNKIYLLIQDDELLEYNWINGAWNPIGDVEFDADKYYTKTETTKLLNDLSNSIKAYTDSTYLKPFNTMAYTPKDDYNPVTKKYADVTYLKPFNNIAYTPKDDYNPVTKKYADSTYLKPFNTVAYTPRDDYNAATKKYVDDAIATSITQVLGGVY